MKSTLIRFCSTLSVMAVLVVMTGCGGGAVDRPSAYPVTGKLTGGSGSLTGVTIVFNPNDATKNTAATGTVKEDGSFELTTGDGRVGVEVGFYKVTLAVGPDVVQQAMENVSGSTGPALDATTAPFPKEYASTETTPKTVEVKAEVNTINVEL